MTGVMVAGLRFCCPRVRSQLLNTLVFGILCYNPGGVATPHRALRTGVCGGTYLYGMGTVEQLYIRTLAS